ncbi:hypothetical protein ACI2KR_27270 [Pseudomonas luteola]
MKMKCDFDNVVIDAETPNESTIYDEVIVNGESWTQRIIIKQDDQMLDLTASQAKQLAEILGSIK